jgi:hypothetical protein
MANLLRHLQCCNAPTPFNSSKDAIPLALAPLASLLYGQLREAHIGKFGSQLGL